MQFTLDQDKATKILEHFCIWPGIKRNARRAPPDHYRQGIADARKAGPRADDLAGLNAAHCKTDWNTDKNNKRDLDQ